MFLAALFLLFVLFPVYFAEPAENEFELKKACLKAVIQSIGMEIAGIKNDDFSVLKPGRKYTLTVYHIYPREYFFTSSYVYVSSF